MSAMEEQTGKVLSLEEFKRLLGNLQVELEHRASMEGSMRYEWGEEVDTYVVAAAIRTGNDMGQGGMVLIRGDTPFPSDVAGRR